MTGYSFKTFDHATGTATSIVADYASADISFEFSDVGALTLSYPKNGVNYSQLSLNRVEVGAFLNGVEMDDARFLLQSSEDDEIDDGKIVSFTGVSLLNMLSNALVYSSDGSVVLAKDQAFASVTAGAILRTLFQQNSTRGGVMSIITWASFSNTVDSAGVAWSASLGAITYTVGVSYLDVIRNLVDNGMIEVKMVGRDLRVYNAGGLGVDRTVQAEPVVLVRGLDFLEAPNTSTNEQVASVALIEGDDGLLKENTDSGLVSTWGRLETFISQGGISDSTTLGVLAAQEISRRSLVRSQRTRKINLHGVNYTPYTSYRVSDYIFSNTKGTNERLRIRQMVISVDQNGIQTASVVLNDKFLEQEIMIARKVNGILGGASASGSVTIPTDDGPDVTVPSQVTGLSWSSAAYQDIDGTTKAQLTISWTGVTTNTNLTAIDDLDHYEVQVKRNSTANWADISSFNTTNTTGYCTVPANTTLDVRVRAADQSGNYGAYSSTSTGTSAADSTAPPTPSTPVVSAYLGQLRIFWDGLGSASQAMPTDFRYTEVHLSTTTGFTPSSSTLVDQLNASGYSVQTSLTYATPYFVKLISVDRSGNKSAASAQGTATPTTVTGLDIAALTVDTSNLANLAVTTAKIGLLQVLNGQIANLAVDDAKIGNMSVGKLTAGILSADMTVSARIKTANTGARVELNSSGFQAYNSAGATTVDIAAATGNATFTGQFQTDFDTSTTPHIKMINSGDRTTIYFTNSAGTNNAFMNTPIDGGGVPEVGINTGHFTYFGGTTSTAHRLFMQNASGMRLESMHQTLGVPIGGQLNLTDSVAEVNLFGNTGNRSGGSVQLGTGGSYINHYLSTGVQTGGSLYLDSSQFSLARNGSGASNGGQFQGDINFARQEVFVTGTLVGQWSIQNDGTLFSTGKLINNYSFSNSAGDMIIAGSGSGTVSGTSFVITYGATCTSTPGVVYGWYSSTQVTHRLSAFNTTSFTVTPASTAAAKIQYWCFRQ